MALIFLLRYPSGSQTYSYSYNTVTHLVEEYILPYVLSESKPPLNSIFNYECKGVNKENYRYMGGSPPVVNVEVVNNDPICCTLETSSFEVNKTNNTNISTPNGTISITSGSLSINDYQASIDGGTTWITGSGGLILFTGLSEGTFAIQIRNVGGVCVVSTSSSIVNVITYPPLLIEETVTPVDFCPVFYPIEYQFELLNNDISIKSDGGGTYLTVNTQDGIDYFNTKPIFKILNNEDYGYVWEITSITEGTPNKYYFGATYTTNQDAIFVPFGKQVFKLYAEKTFNSFAKIADISVSPDVNGIYKIRVDGFLQSVFQVNQPAVADDLNIHKKFYISPVEFDMENPSTIRTAVYSAIPSLTQYNEELTPLGPAPINFINEQTQKGHPVIFSILNDETKRVTNILSSIQTDITTPATEVFFSALPGNIYNFEWLSGDLITDLNTDPELPEWITIISSDEGLVKLLIDTNAGTSGGDYNFPDYSEDYNALPINDLVGCYSFDFYDGFAFLFTLNICVYPVQGIKGVCKKGYQNDPFNIAWINKQGGWSSYVFEGKKTLKRTMGKEYTFKRGLELKKGSTGDLYTECTVNFAGKAIRDLMFIDTLRTSIQAYLYNEETLTWDIPIIIDKENYDLYSLPHKISEQTDTFTFTYSNEIVNQKQ